MYRKTAALLIAAVMTLTFAPAVSAQSLTAVSGALSKADAKLGSAAGYVTGKVKSPGYGSIGGEWMIAALARSGAKVPDGYFEGYVKSLGEYVTEKKGILSTRKSTEYSRVILALASLGIDARDFFGYDLTSALGDFDFTLRQGLNGAIFALIALDSREYPMPQKKAAKVQATREKYLDAILDAQLSDGGWNISETAGSDASSDADATAIALQALAKYTDRAEVSRAVDSALECLSGLQLDDGGFQTLGKANAESCAQALIALCELGIPTDDTRFIKNGRSVYDALCSYMTADGGFRHLKDGIKPNLMATEQSLCALAALERLESGADSFYRMSDAQSIVGGTVEKFPGRDPDVKKSTVISNSVSFTDIVERDRSCAEALALRGIINGRGNGCFAPDENMTRAEFCAIVVRALGLESAGAAAFSDVTRESWHYGYVGAAYSKGIVNGVGDGVFAPDGTITREAAAVMVARAAKLCGLDVSITKSELRDILSQFGDYTKSSDWAREGLAFCYKSGISDESDDLIRPFDAIKRREVAQMIYALMERAELL